MSQDGDYVIANASGSTVRADVNETLINILESNSGGSAPSYKRTGSQWLNTGVSPNELQIYNGSTWGPIIDMSGNHLAEDSSGSYGYLNSTGNIEICALNSSPYVDFKRTNIDYDCRIFMTDDTNYDLKVNTGGQGDHTLACTFLGTGGIEVGGAGVSGDRSAPDGGYRVGVVTAKGYATRTGMGGSCANNAFNFAWSSPNLTAYVDSSTIGVAATSSDYRVKQNIALQTESGIDKVKRLKPSTFQYKDYENVFKADGVTREGFIAHEVQEVIPSGATGKKDGTDIQSLKLDAIVSVLTKALQEAVVKIETLETKVAALEAK